VRASTAGLDAIGHLFGRDQFLAGPMAAALGAYLVLDVHGGRAGLDHGADGARDVERSAPAGVDVDQQRQREASVMRRTSVSTSSMVLMPRSGNAERIGGHASAGKIKRAEAVAWASRAV
jgi:hypothetical protein